MPQANIKRSNWLSFFFFVFLCSISLVINVITIKDGHNWGGDFSQYIIHAQNIVRFSPYSSEIMINPPAIYPPGFSILLSPIVAMFGLNFQILKMINIIFWFGAVLFGYLFLLDRVSRNLSRMFCLLLVFSSNFFVFKQNVLSDIPFFFFSILAFYLFSKYDEKKGQGDFENKYLVGFVLCIAMTLLVRSAGIIFFISSIYYFGVIQRRWKMSLCFFLALGLVFLLQTFWIGFHPSIFSVLIKEPLKYAVSGVENVYRVLESAIDFFYPSQSLISTNISQGFIKASIVIAPMTLIAVSFLFIYKSFYRTISFLGCFSFFYFLLLIFWAGLGGRGFTRFVLPLIIPIFIYGYSWGFFVFNKLFHGRKKKLYESFFFLGILLPLTINVLNIYKEYSFDDDVLLKKENVELFDWVKNNINKNEHYMFDHPRPMALMTKKIGTSSWNIVNVEGGGQLEVDRLPEILNQKNVSYLIMNKQKDRWLIDKFRNYLHWRNVVWENNIYQVYKLKESS